MNNIKIRQELPENLRFLKAQRVIYADAKKIYKWQLTITIIIVVIMNFTKLIAKNTFHVDLAVYIGLVSVIITLIDLLFMGNYLSKLKTNGAKVQEMFDCSIYNMEWNETNSGEKPENSVVEEALSKYVLNAKAPLTNWYHIDLDDLTHEQAVLRCQETNLEYDRKLRYHFENDCTILCVVVVIASFFVATIIDVSLQSYLLNFVTPSLPLLVVLIKIILDNRKAAKSLDDVRKAARKLKASATIPTMAQLRQVQDKLYCSRKDNTLIPENYYQYRRTKLEQSTKNNAI